MKPERQKFFISSQMPWEPVAPGLRRQIMGTDNQIMLVKLHFDTGAVAAMHSHFHAQSSFVVSGRFEMEINGEKHLLGPGDGFYMEPNAVHGGLCLEEGELIDCFTPVREDFLK